MASQINLEKKENTAKKKGASTSDPALLLYMSAYVYTLRIVIRLPVTEPVLNVVFLF